MATHTTDDRKGWRLAVFCLLWTTYGVSLVLPVTGRADTMGATTGLLALVMGWSGLGIVVELANVAFLCGTIGYLVRQTEMALFTGVAATAVACLAPKVYGFELGTLRAGYYVWVAAMALLAAAAAFELLSERRAAQGT